MARVPDSEASVLEPAQPTRRRLEIRGQVQGVGFRPYVYRLALARGLCGYVANDSNGAVVEAEGAAAALDAFERDLVDQLPPLARITNLMRLEVPAAGETSFRIRTSQADSRQRPEVTPDAATCAACRRELLDPADRRYRYPFINCTDCGPRYSIIRDVPYDRPQTTMRAFTMCPPCAAEYADPANRRFHAQPNACPDCGPQVRLIGGAITDAPDPIRAAARLLRDGGVVAVKGLGGYHLACRADLEEVVRRLRTRKLRDGKPLAVMVADVAAAGRLCRLSGADVDALTSPAAPIVLAPQAPGHGLAPSVAPGCRDFGVMLAYTPVHHLLFAEGLGPLVMTSANIAGQPLTYRDDDALSDLGDVADALLVHDREIFRPIDDSVVLTFRDEVVPLRRARGYAPRPLRLAGLTSAGGGKTPQRILAVGGELKSTVCLLAGDEAVLSEHLGDLTHPATYRHFMRAIDRLKQLCGFTPEVIACDRHPRYLSTEYAQRHGLPVIAIQHHHAHIVSVMAEWAERGPVIGLACDGTGWGTDGAVWGCELLRCDAGGFARLGHLAYFPLVGGDRAALETWRPAVALLRASEPDDWRTLLHDCTNSACPAPEQLDVFERQAAGAINAPRTSSLGRVFDAASCLLGLCVRNRHEAEAAMRLEAAAEEWAGASEPLAFDVAVEDGRVSFSLTSAIWELAVARLRGEAAPALAARFHETVAQMLAAAAGHGCRLAGVNTVALSGGCFANRRLLARLTELLEAQGRRVLYHRQVPCGDGGVALGQAVAAAWQLAGSRAPR